MIRWWQQGGCGFNKRAWCAAPYKRTTRCGACLAEIASDYSLISITHMRSLCLLVSPRCIICIILLDSFYIFLSNLQCSNFQITNVIFTSHHIKVKCINWYIIQVNNNISSNKIRFSAIQIITCTRLIGFRAALSRWVKINIWFDFIMRNHFSSLLFEVARY